MAPRMKTCCGSRTTGRLPRLGVTYNNIGSWRKNIKKALNSLLQIGNSFKLEQVNENVFSEPRILNDL